MAAPNPNWQASAAALWSTASSAMAQGYTRYQAAAAAAAQHNSAAAPAAAPAASQRQYAPSHHRPAAPSAPPAEPQLQPCDFAAFGCGALVPRGGAAAHNAEFQRYHRELLQQGGSVFLSSSSASPGRASAPPAAAVAAARSSGSSGAGGSARSAAVSEPATSPAAMRRRRGASGGGGAGGAGGDDNSVEVVDLTTPGAAAAAGGGGDDDDGSSAAVLVPATDRQELVHNALAVANAAEEFCGAVAVSAGRLADRHLHLRNANAVLGVVNTFLTTEAIHPLAKVGIAGGASLILRGVMAVMARWFLLWFLCASTFKYVDQKFPRVPDVARVEGDEETQVIAFNERRTVAIGAWAALCLYLFVSIV